MDVRGFLTRGSQKLLLKYTWGYYPMATKGAAEGVCVKKSGYAAGEKVCTVIISY